MATRKSRKKSWSVEFTNRSEWPDWFLRLVVEVCQTKEAT